MSENIKRMKYATGLFMDDTEFRTEQLYNVRMRRLHNRHLHSPGIVWGLGLEITAPLTVKIEKGMALDLYFDHELGEELSREVCVTTDEIFTIPDNTYDPGEEAYLWIEYSEIEADSSPKAGGGNIHTIETFRAFHGRTAPPHEERQILLGRLIFNSVGAIEAISLTDAAGNDLLRYAGFTGRQWETDRLTLSDDEIAENKPFLDGAVFPDHRSGIVVNAERTRFSGLLEVNENASFFAGLSTSVARVWNNARSFYASLVGDVTENRTITIPDRSFTLAADSDLQQEINDRTVAVENERVERIQSIEAAANNIRFTRTANSGPAPNSPVYLYQDGNYLFWSNSEGGPWRPFA